MLGKDAQRDAWGTARFVLLAALSTTVLMLIGHVARQSAHRAQEKQVAVVEALDGRIARTRTRIAEKTRLADS